MPSRVVPPSSCSPWSCKRGAKSAGSQWWRQRKGGGMASLPLTHCWSVLKLAAPSWLIGWPLMAGHGRPRWWLTGASEALPPAGGQPDGARRVSNTSKTTTNIDQNSFHMYYYLSAAKMVHFVVIFMCSDFLVIFAAFRTHSLSPTFLPSTISGETCNQTKASRPHHHAYLTTQWSLPPWSHLVFSCFSPVSFQQPCNALNPISRD